MLQFDSAGDLQKMPEYFNMDHADNCRKSGTTEVDIDFYAISGANWTL